MEIPRRGKIEEEEESRWKRGKINQSFPDSTKFVEEDVDGSVRSFFRTRDQSSSKVIIIAAHFRYG